MLKFEVWILMVKVWSSKFEVWSLKFEVWNLKFEVEVYIFKLKFKVEVEAEVETWSLKCEVEVKANTLKYRDMHMVSRTGRSKIYTKLQKNQILYEYFSNTDIDVRSLGIFLKHRPRSVSVRIFDAFDRSQTWLQMRTVIRIRVWKR